MQGLEKTLEEMIGRNYDPKRSQSGCLIETCQSHTRPESALQNAYGNKGE